MQIYQIYFICVTILLVRFLLFKNVSIKETKVPPTDDKKMWRYVPGTLCLFYLCQKQVVALKGRNTTGPPSRAAPWWVTLRRGVLQTTTDDRRQRLLKLEQLRFCPLHYV